MTNNIQGRILVKIANLNYAGVMCSRVVVSPEAMHELQSESRVGDFFWNEDHFEFGMLPRQSIFGLPLVVDPDLTGEQVSLEIDA
jgi:hypothetical protein